MLPIADTVRSRSFPLVNWLLIAANILIFLAEPLLERGSRALIFDLALVPARLLADPGPRQLITLVTSMFLHAGWLHLFSNLLALYIFGDNVEDRMGSGRYLLFYLLCGLIAGLTHVFFNPDSRVPTVGASGAISGVLGAYFVLFPTARVTTLVVVLFLPLFIELPAIIYLGLWFLSQVFSGAFTIVAGLEAYSGVAWWAHAGGFLAGVLLVKVFARRQPRRWYADEYWPW